MIEKIDIPTKQTNIQWQGLEDICEQYIGFLSSEDFTEDQASDFKDYIFETALECLYGKNIWDYTQNKLNSC